MDVNNDGFFEKLKKDEPVAWFWFDERDGGEWIHIADNQVNAEKFGDAKVIPLYTTPPQRTWVGLTDEDVENCLDVAEGSLGRVLSLIEAKLKEKNT
jgi:hypothetical protein